MKKISLLVAALVAIGLLVFGLLRLQFTADIFGLLPKELPVIDALATYQKGFKREQELLVSLRAKSSFAAETAAGELADSLRANGLAQQVIWQNPAEQDNDVLSELLALQWLNVPPAKMQALAAGFSEQKITEALRASQLASYEADDPFEAAIELSDPFGLAKISADGSLESNTSLVASADGRFRVLYLSPVAGQELAAWALEIKRWVADWQGDYPDLEVGFAGTPVFNQEFSDSLVSDMQKAVLGTLLLVGLLFFWAHRRLLPLLWLVTLLGVVLAATVAIGGQIFGTLNVISLGYAAVLMGLAADYGLLLYQAHRSSTQSAAKTIKQVAPSILWAALTTSVAFLMVGRGSLPGMTQLGVLVAVGIVVAAVVMLGLYLWPLHKTGSSPVMQKAHVISSRAAWLVSAAMALLALSVLAWRLPAVDTDPDTLGPGQVAASQVQDEIELQLGRDGESLFVLFAASEPEAVKLAMQAVDAVLATALADDVLASYSLPNWWPNAEAQAVNKPLMLDIASRWPAIVAQAEAMDYPVDFMTVTENALAQFGQVAARDGIGLPALAGSAWLFGQTAAINTAADELSGYFAVGQLALADGTTNQQRAQLVATVANVPHAQLSGWPLASAGLLQAMQGDLLAVAVPMLVVLLVVLLLAYRGVGEILFSLLSITLTLLALMALMAVLGWEWNLMNILALPLLVGVTVDYSIHTQLALQRFKGDLQQVYQHVGHAIALAGITTAIGFGSLAFANNQGLATLGKVASSGVVLACIISVLLQPHWWRALHKGKIPNN